MGGKAMEQTVGTGLLSTRICPKPRLERLVCLFQIFRHLPVVEKIDEKSLAIAKRGPDLLAALIVVTPAADEKRVCATGRFYIATGAGLVVFWAGGAMTAALTFLRHNPLLWLLVFVPVLFVAEALAPDAHTMLFVLSVLAVVPLAALLSQATESVAAKTGDAVGGLLNATLGNLTELVIALTALRAGQYMLVKASIAGAIVTNSLFMLGASFLLGGLKYHVQEYNRISARLQASLLFLATIALLIPSAVGDADLASSSAFTQTLSLGLAAMLMVAYGLGMLFSLKTHRELFASAAHDGGGEEVPWPIRVALILLAVVTVVVALVSEVFVESVQEAAVAFGMTPAFVGFIVVALVGGAAEMASAFAGARSNRLDLSVGIALGSASQIALFVAPMLVLLSYVIGPTPMDLRFWPGAVVMMLIATLTGSLVTNSGRSTWFVGVLVLMVYLIFAMTLYLLPPRL
jgi:Ca2+:H+ antiporter